MGTRNGTSPVCKIQFLAFPRCRGLLVRYSDTSSTEDYEPARERFTVGIGDVVGGMNAMGAGDGEDPRTRG
jgi:hypothetical protein